MYDLKLAWRNIVSRPVQTIITILVVAMAIALFVTVTHLNDALQRGIIRAGDPFGVMVVGAKGSGQQLVLSTLLLQGNPVGNIPRHIYDELATDPRVALAIPLAMGDNVGGARIIGTNHDFFQLRPSALEPPTFRLTAGNLFQDDFEAVLGSQAAAGLSLQIGDEFVPAHGVEQGLARDVHDVRHRVVGILAPSHTPFDNAAFTSIDSVIKLHGEHDTAEHNEAEHDAAEHDTAEHDTAEHNEAEHDAAEHDAAEHDTAEHDAAEHTGEEHTGEEPAHLDDDDQITAILVKPTGFIEQNGLWQEFYTGTEAQAAFPGRELGGLFDLLNQGQELLRFVGYLAAVMAALTLFLAVYSAMGARERLLAIMRGLGANRGTVFRVVLFETVLIALLGALAGRLLGYAVAAAVATRLTQQSAIPITVRYLPELEMFLWLLPLALGILAGLIPAVQAYRVNVIEKLFPA